MEYAIYFEADGQSYRLPVNPEEISFSKKMDTEQHRMLTGNQIVIPMGRALEEISFEAEFPYDERHYTNQGFHSADVWEKLLRQWQEQKKAVRFIASNGLGTDISMLVLITQSDHVEKAGEEGDKYISLKLMEYAVPAKRYVAVANVSKSYQVSGAAATNASVTFPTSYTVEKGDTLWAIAKKYYESGSQYTKIYQANADKIRNPNLIYPGQVLTIPA